MVGSPEEFERGWGADRLVRLPPLLATAKLPSDACEFLVQCGMPAFIRFFPGSSEAVLTFCRLASGLIPVLSEETVGPPLPPEWSAYWIMGDEFFCNGAAWWCIHELTGRVDRVDIEIEPPIEFVNSSVAHCAAALLAAKFWSAGCNVAADTWPLKVEQFKNQLVELDPPCMQSDRNFWPVYLDFIRSEGSHLGAFEAGSRTEGERALKTGPW